MGWDIFEHSAESIADKQTQSGNKVKSKDHGKRSIFKGVFKRFLVGIRRGNLWYELITIVWDFMLSWLC